MDKELYMSERWIFSKALDYLNYQGGTIWMVHDELCKRAGIKLNGNPHEDILLLLYELKVIEK